jgi:acyl carrier protein
LESIINAYISGELAGKPELLPLKNDTVLLETGILDSLSVLKLMLFLEEQFGVVVDPADLVAEHFQTVDAICAYLRRQQQAQGIER